MVDGYIESLLDKVKANAIINHNEDDGLLLGIIAAACDYAQTYQRVSYDDEPPPATEQAIIMLASHWYESRDGTTGGFFADSANAAEIARATVERLLALNKQWVI